MGSPNLSTAAKAFLAPVRGSASGKKEIWLTVNSIPNSAFFAVTEDKAGSVSGPGTNTRGTAPCILGPSPGTPISKGDGLPTEKKKPTRTADSPNFLATD